MSRMIDADALRIKVILYANEPVKLKDRRWDTRCSAIIADTIGMIDEAPSVDATPVVHGRWIKMTGMMPPEYHGHYECSECQWHMKGIRNSWTKEEEFLYCPNCGTKMDGDTAELNWRNKPPTEKQLAYIMQMQEDAGMNGAIPLPQFMGKTRGEASDYINTNNGKQFKSFDYDSHGDNYGDRI